MCFLDFPRDCTVTIPFGYGEVSCEAIFDTLEEAQRFYGINTDPVISREVIRE